MTKYALTFHSRWDKGNSGGCPVPHKKSSIVIPGMNNGPRVPTVPTKSGVMLGLGETREQVEQALRDLRAHDVDMITLGQYLQPTPHHHPAMVVLMMPEHRPKPTTTTAAAAATTTKASSSSSSTINKKSSNTWKN